MMTESRLPPRKKSPLPDLGYPGSQGVPDKINRTKDISMKRDLVLIVSVVGAIGLLLALATIPGGISETSAQQPRLAPIATDGAASAQPWVRYPGWPTRDTSKFNTLAAIKRGEIVPGVARPFLQSGKFAFRDVAL